MNATLIAKRAVIASFNSGQWRVIRRHEAETRAENARHNLTNEARVDIKICSHPALEEISRLISAARTDHYRMTVPAADRGMRLLPSRLTIEHNDMMQARAGEFQRAVHEFVLAYDQIRQDAPARLNGLYVSAHWPDVSAVRESFRLSCRYLPVPSLGHWDEWMAESANTATQEVRDRIGEALRRYTEKLSQPDPIFRDSLVGNLVEVLNLADDLNIGQDPAITDLVARARPLATIEPDQLREDQTLRSDSAKRAADLCSMFKL